MSSIANLNRYRLQKARRRMPLAAYLQEDQCLIELDTVINKSLNLVLADPKLDQRTKEIELRQTLSVYRHVTERLDDCQLPYPF
ncbi:hypothetical protein [Halioxenophilus aromaticivorans]